MMNHPIHIIDENGKLSPSSFIPFCEFGGNMSLLGTKIKEFDVPVCTSFKPAILNDQLCYEIDLNEKIPKQTQAKDLEIGLLLLVDENIERQFSFKEEKSSVVQDSIFDIKDDNTFMVYISTLGK